MNTLYCVSALSGVLTKLKEIIADNAKKDRRTVIFCEDRLSLAAERAVCSAVEGTFTASVYTFSRFLSASNAPHGKILSGQGSAMVLRKLIESNRENLSCFKNLSSAQSAQVLYDTIALLYSSRVSAEDILGVSTGNALLSRKLADLSLLYSAYFNYLAENGLQDRNTYLKSLPEVIKNSESIRGADVVFLGFQTYTRSTAECVSACMRTADNVYGIFTGGKDEIYVNEAVAGFSGCAAEFGTLKTYTLDADACSEAAVLRKNLFNPDCFHTAKPTPTSKVHLFEASDWAEEAEFIAASIQKHIALGERYRNISVMLPDANNRATLERIFKQYAIPYYVDISTPLSSHFICEFICAYLACAHDGCLPNSVNSVVSSPLFDASDNEKDIFRNYLLRLGNYRGGVKRQPVYELCEKLGYNFASVCEVRNKFLQGLKLLQPKSSGGKIGEGIKSVLQLFNAEDKLLKLSEQFKDSLPTQSALCERAFSEAVSVIDEAISLTENDLMTCAEFSKLLKSGFAADKVSIIPPKQDAVFVGDISATANTGSHVVFAACLTADVPTQGADTALLTDRELTSLEGLDLFVSPKISVVNMRARETAALNICAFSSELYLSYPLRLNGAECATSEVVEYAKALFATLGGNPITPLNQRRLDKSGRAVPYYCSGAIPTLKQLVRFNGEQAVASSVYEVLKRANLKAEADKALQIEDKKRDITLGLRLFTNGGSVSPTTLENYFACPYLAFMRQGLRLAEREEGTHRPLDSGNFIHAVLKRTAEYLNQAVTAEQMSDIAKTEAQKMLEIPPYSSLKGEKSGEYTANKLVDEAIEVCLGAWRQIKNSSFSVLSAESGCEVQLDKGLKLFGRIDRVDSFEDMVRVIDYKTGQIDSKPDKYYMGLKLQLQLYLLAAAKGKRAVAAYYFPAQVEFKDEKDGDFRLKGFMDGGADVVRASDINVQPKQKSEYFDAYLEGRKTDCALNGEDFYDFLNYGALVARKGANELVSGNIAPSPTEDSCKYCKMGGCCGFSRLSGDTERKTCAIKSSDVVRVVREERGD